MSALSRVQTHFENKVDFEGLQRSHDWSSEASWLTRVSLRGGVHASGDVVKYRGMIQDSFDPELYKTTYMHDGIPVTSAYRDVVPLEWTADGTGEQIDERLVYYLVPVPGEAKWARPSCNTPQSNTAHSAVDIQEHKTKKKRERQVDDMDVENKTPVLDKPISIVQLSGPALPINLENNPIPNEKETPCMIKIYAGESNLRLHDVVTVVGILSIDAEASMYTEIDTNGLGQDARDVLPWSVAPRVHVLKYEIESEDDDVQNPNARLPDETQWRDARASCVSWLQIACGDDALAAEWLLLWAMSSSPRKSSAMPDQDRSVIAGKLSLGLTRTSPAVARNLEKVFQTLIHRHQVIRLPDILSGPFCPHKDFDQNRVLAGRLQVAAGTRLVVDETRLEPQVLNEAALKNVRALNQIARFQTLEYDFQFYQRDERVDQPMLVLSSSDLKCALVPDLDCTFRMASQTNTSQDVFALANIQRVELCRDYLEASRRRARGLDIPTEVGQAIEADFVNARNSNMDKDGRPLIGEADLHLWLNLARLHAASVGARFVRVEDYMRAKILDAERKKR